MARIRERREALQDKIINMTLEQLREMLRVAWWEAYRAGHSDRLAGRVGVHRNPWADTGSLERRG